MYMRIPSNLMYPALLSTEYCLLEKILQITHRWYRMKYLKLILVFTFYTLLPTAMLTALSTPNNTYAQGPKPTEYQVKAAFLYNFVKFIEWPPTHNDSEIILYVLGKDPFGSAFDSIKQKRIKGKKLVVKRISSIRDLEDCSMLFISSSEEANIKDIIGAIDDLSILTIGDTKGYANRGVIINLYLEKKKTRFEVNLDAVKNTDIVISSKLLGLAKIVKR